MNPSEDMAQRIEIARATETVARECDRVQKLPELTEMQARRKLQNMRELFGLLAIYLDGVSGMLVALDDQGARAARDNLHKAIAFCEGAHP